MKSRYSWKDWSALAALLLVVVVCLPIFLCMPLWVDATFYDICARTIQRGGVLYRDTFDTNLPGMPWLHLAVRSLFGWRSEVLRAADFLVVAAIAFLLVRWDPILSRAARIWTAVALLAYYFSTTEWCHNQRDVWMLLPCLAALYLRRRQLLASRPASKTLLLSVMEGLLWGAAVWIKPMALVPAAACWLVSVCWRYRQSFAWRPALLDVAGSLAGGLSDWGDLQRIAAFLRGQEMRQGDLICLHEATMPLYLEMDRAPPLRYLLYGQATGVYRGHRPQLLEELSASPARYAVSDLAIIGWRPRQLPDEDAPETEPPSFPKPMAESFPWSQPVVFRSGRYAVHRLSVPITKLWP